MDVTFSPTRRHILAGAGAGLAAPAAAVAAVPRRDILLKGVSAAKLAQTLAGRETWRPWPRAADRAGWNALGAALRKTLLEAGEQALAVKWEVLPATLFLEFKRIGNRSHYEAACRNRRDKLRSLVLAECVEGKGRFLDEIVNGLWATCEETFWGYPAHLGPQKAGSGLPDVAEPVIDLFAAETSAMLAWTLYLIGPAFDKVSPLVRERIYREIERRIIVPGLERTDWGWMGFGKNSKPNNWNPWICSNWLTSVLIADRDDKRRQAGVMKILAVLDNFLNGYDDDGGCDEGPGYWGVAGGALFDALELLHSASGGAIDFYSVPLVKEIGRYIYRAHIAGDWYTNFADASAVVHIDGNMVWRYGRRIGDPKMAALGAWAERQREGKPGGSLGRQLPHLFTGAEMAAAPAAETLVRDVWLPGVQVMAARVREGSAQGLYLAAQGGHNAESHNHNDVGNFLVYAAGKPAFIDVGVETYSAKTFSSKRYEIWTMQSAYHNCPTVGGVMQAAGRDFAARDVQYRSDDAGAEFSLDLAGAYPKEAGLKSWRRTLRFDRAANSIEIIDRYAAAKAPALVTLTLMTPWPMKQPAPGTLALPVEGGPEVRVAFDPAALAASQEEISIADGRLRAAWGPRLYRILLTAREPRPERQFVIRITQA
jgi:hypothetical protein